MEQLAQFLMRSEKERERLPLSGMGSKEEAVRAAVPRVYKHKTWSKSLKWLGVVARACCYG